MNLGTMAKIGAFLSSHPGLIEMLNRFPKLEPGTGKLLLEFLERALREENPEAYLRTAIKNALDMPQSVRSVVVSQKKGERGV